MGGGHHSAEGTGLDETFLRALFSEKNIKRITNQLHIFCQFYQIVQRYKISNSGK